MLLAQRPSVNSSISPVAVMKPVAGDHGGPLPGGQQRPYWAGWVLIGNWWVMVASLVSALTGLTFNKWKIMTAVKEGCWGHKHTRCEFLSWQIKPYILFKTMNIMNTPETWILYNSLFYVKTQFCSNSQENISWFQTPVTGRNNKHMKTCQSVVV